MTAVRYAVYFAPGAESELWRFGSSVIGYDAASGQALPQTVPAGISAGDWRELTREPRRYGFHATLKAPFRLADGTTELELLSAVDEVSASAVPFDLAVQVERISSFVAFVPEIAPKELGALEEVVVTRLERFRAPLNEAEIARRERHPLTDRQRSLLATYGYPYVLDEFRFHMSLSGSLPAELIPAVVEFLRRGALQAGIASAAIDRLAVFRESEGQFRILRTFPLRVRSLS